LSPPAKIPVSTPALPLEASASAAGEDAPSNDNNLSMTAKSSGQAEGTKCDEYYTIAKKVHD
jgi:hypothetical protein